MSHASILAPMTIGFSGWLSAGGLGAYTNVLLGWASTYGQPTQHAWQNLNISNNRWNGFCNFLSNTLQVFHQRLQNNITGVVATAAPIATFVTVKMSNFTACVGLAIVAMLLLVFCIPLSVMSPTSASVGASSVALVGGGGGGGSGSSSAGSPPSLGGGSTDGSSGCTSSGSSHNGGSGGVQSSQAPVTATAPLASLTSRVCALSLVPAGVTHMVPAQTQTQIAAPPASHNTPACAQTLVPASNTPTMDMMVGTAQAQVAAPPASHNAAAHDPSLIARVLATVERTPSPTNVAQRVSSPPPADPTPPEDPMDVEVTDDSVDPDEDEESSSRKRSISESSLSGSEGIERPRQRRRHQYQAQGDNNEPKSVGVCAKMKPVCLLHGVKEIHHNFNDLNSLAPHNNKSKHWEF